MHVSVGVCICERVRQLLMKMVLLIVEKIPSAPLSYFPLAPKHSSPRNLSLKTPAMPVWYFSGSCSQVKGPE